MEITKSYVTALGLPQRDDVDQRTKVRPVKCLFCERPMYYLGDLRWVPEMELTKLFGGGGEGVERRHMHVCCWERMRQIIGPPRPMDVNRWPAIPS